VSEQAIQRQALEYLMKLIQVGGGGRRYFQFRELPGPGGGPVMPSKAFKNERFSDQDEHTP
jgi:hypothetical protein